MAYASKDGRRVNVTDTADLPLSRIAFDYSSPLPEDRRQFVDKAMMRMYPGKSYKIIGGLLDYSAPDVNKAYKEKPIGDYLVEVGGDTIALCAREHMDLDAFDVESHLFMDFSLENIKATQLIGGFLDPENIIVDIDGVKVYRTQPVIGTPLTTDWDNMEKLGQLLGRMKKASGLIQMVPDEEDIFPVSEYEKKWKNSRNQYLEDWKGYSDAATVSLWQQGLELVEREMPENNQDEDVARILSYVGSWQEMGSRSRNYNILAPIPRNILQDKSGELCVVSQMNAARGYVPDMARDVTYDLAFAANRIILATVSNAEELQGRLGLLLLGYNQVAQTNVSLPDLIEGMRRAHVLNILLTAAQARQVSPDSAFGDNVKIHVEKAIRPVSEKLALLDQIEEKLRRVQTLFPVSAPIKPGPL